MFSLFTVDADIDSLGSKSEDSSISLNGSIDSDKITLYGGTEFVRRPKKSDRSRSVDFSRKNLSSGSEIPVVGAATIIMNPSANNPPATPQVNHHVQSPVPDITLVPPTLKEPSEKPSLNYRRSSESDVGVRSCIFMIMQKLFAIDLFFTSFSFSNYSKSY